MRLNKRCEVADFHACDFTKICKRIFGPDEMKERDWPMQREDRKFWEIAMAVLAVDRHVPDDRRRMVLGVGSGIEGTSFALTQWGGAP